MRFVTTFNKTMEQLIREKYESRERQRKPYKVDFYASNPLTSESFPIFSLDFECTCYSELRERLHKFCSKLNMKNVYYYCEQIPF